MIFQQRHGKHFHGGYRVLTGLQCGVGDCGLCAGAVYLVLYFIFTALCYLTKIYLEPMSFIVLLFKMIINQKMSAFYP